MPTSRLREVIQHVRKSALLREGAGLTDGQLLACFIEHRDQAAFAALVKRHAPMVWGVCRRLLRNHHDAEEAFQATFLVLVRKAASILPREMVANWLYGVAHQTARKASALAARRRTRERQVTEMPEPAVQPDLWDDLQPLLDEELSRLPDKFRAVIVLCELEGKTRKEAAQQLSCPEGTVASRLATARTMLAKRLARHGLAVPGGVLAGLLSLGVASAGPPPAAVVSATIEAASRFAAGHAAASGVISANVAALTGGVLRTMLLNKLKTMAPVVLLLALIAFGGLYALQLAEAQTARQGQTDRQRGKDPGAGEKKGRRASAGTLLLARRGGLFVLTPEGKEKEEVTAPKGSKLHFFSGRFSPDGSRVAYVVTAGRAPRPPARAGMPVEPWPFKVLVRKLGATEPLAVIDLSAQQLDMIWAPDGRHLLVTKESGDPSVPSFETVRLDPKTGRVEPFELPDGARVLDCSRDGKTLLVVQRQKEKDRLGLVAVQGRDAVRELIPLNGRSSSRVARFSPDGSRVLYTDVDPADKDLRKWGISSKPYLLDLATRKSQPLLDFPTNGQALGVAWSPNGKRIAYSWKQVHREVFSKDSISVKDWMVATEAFLMVSDPDGRNARTIASSRSDNALNAIFGVIDWR
jgi:RNA polymerase sigma factor (sigma-70 family)